jgi:hypothetical protein
MADNEKMTPAVIEEIKQVLRKAGLTESDVTEAIAAIWTVREVAPIRDAEEYRVYEDRYRKMMQDAGFVGQQRTWEEYMDYVRTPAGRLALAIFNRMADWKEMKGVP